MDKDSIIKSLERLAKKPEQISKSHNYGTLVGLQNLMKKAREGKSDANTETGHSPS